MNVNQEVARLDQRIDALTDRAVGELIGRTVSMKFKDATAQELLKAAAQRRLDGETLEAIEKQKAQLAKQQEQLDDIQRRLDFLTQALEENGSFVFGVKGELKNVQTRNAELAQEIDAVLKLKMRTDELAEFCAERLKTEQARKALVKDVLWPFGGVSQ